jgi:hypothetical protein
MSTAKTMTRLGGCVERSNDASGEYSCHFASLGLGSKVSFSSFSYATDDVKIVSAGIAASSNSGWTWHTAYAEAKLGRSKQPTSELRTVQIGWQQRLITKALV